MDPQGLFSNNTIHNINVYNEASKNESHTGGDINVKFTPTQKVAIQAICSEHGLKTSTFVRDMVDYGIELFPYHEKLKRHKDLLISMLKSLP